MRVEAEWCGYKKETSRYSRVIVVAKSIVEARNENITCRWFLWQQIGGV
jgi:hypothetical protein